MRLARPRWGSGLPHSNEKPVPCGPCPVAPSPFLGFHGFGNQNLQILPGPGPLPSDSVSPSASNQAPSMNLPHPGKLPLSQAPTMPPLAHPHPLLFSPCGEKDSHLPNPKTSQVPQHHHPVLQFIVISGTLFLIFLDVSPTRLSWGTGIVLCSPLCLQCPTQCPACSHAKNE